MAPGAIPHVVGSLLPNEEKSKGFVIEPLNELPSDLQASAAMNEPPTNVSQANLFPAQSAIEVRTNILYSYMLSVTDFTQYPAVFSSVRHASFPTKELDDS